MLSNYVKIALRNLLRYKGSNFVNVFGLSMGLTCCTLCYLHIQYELGYDKFHEKGSQIFRVVLGDRSSSDFWVKMAPPIPPLLQQHIPEIQNFARFTSVSYSPKVVVEANNNFFSESFFMMADPDFLQIFSFPLLKGQVGNVLADKNAVVLSESTARKLFGTDDPIGKLIKLKDNNLDFQVTGIAADVQGQSHLRFDYLISFENLERVLGEGRSLAWGEYNYFNYFLLDAGADPLAVENKIHKISVPHYDGGEEFLDKLFLQPLHDIHFQFNRGNLLPTYDKKYIYIFSAVAVALLLIACINYINLAIALSIKRVKEIGVRKAVGASRVQLTLQFMSESVCTLALALMVGLLLLEGLLPILNPLLDSNITTDYGDPVFLSFLLGVSAIVGLVSGSYLSFYANSYRTASILQGAPRNRRERFSLQNILVLTQFSISIVLIISSLIIADQLNFIQNRNIGIDYQQVVNVSLFSKPQPSTIQTLKDELKTVSGVADVSASSFLPGRANWHQTVWWEGQTEEYSMYILNVDKDFFRTMNMKLLEGSEDEIAAAAEQTDQYILNESAVKIIGWDQALGKPFSPFGQKRNKPVAGVIQDFNFKSLHSGMDPLVVVVSEKMAHNQLSIRISGENIPASMEKIEAICKKVLPEVPFEFEFLDEKFHRLYTAEVRLGNVISWLTVMSVFFSLMGLYGLLSFNIENRTKEIAIRKSLGVSLAGLLLLFSKKYFRLLSLGAIIAAPATYFLIQTWLDNFTYKVEPRVFTFAGACLLVFAALVSVILLKSVAFTKINPAVSLKYE